MKALHHLCIVPCLLLANCATIVSKSSYPIAVSSNPSGAKFTVRNQTGAVVNQGVTPTTIILPSSAGYFQPASYSLEFSRKGSGTQTVPLQASMNGWYAGNLLIGGLVGLLIVDPMSGAMWRLDESVTTNLSPMATVKTEHGGNLQIVDRSQIPAGMEKHLVALR
jgi:hypothetical protein